jgi:DNA adenine methylase
MKSYEPVIKWSGSKKKVAAPLAALFPRSERFFDPFVGSGAILPHITSPSITAADIIPELVDLWRLIQQQPEQVAQGYATRWENLQKQGHTAYYEVREAFNRDRDPEDFLFLTRTCVNGLIRFNAAGEFNNSLHHTRPGIAPQRMASVIKSWSHKLAKAQFLHSDYRDTLAGVQKGDAVFLDPPYAHTKGRYHPNGFDVIEFFKELERLNRIGAFWVLTFDGQAGERVYESGLPESIYKHRLQLPTGNSPFTKMMGTGIDAVTESVFLNFDPTAEASRQFTQWGQQPSPARVGVCVQNGLLFSFDEFNR